MSLRALSRTRATLCSLAQVRESLARSGTPSASVADETLQLILDGVRSAFEAELGRPLLRGTYEETLSGNGRARLYLTATPVVLGSVVILLDGDAVTDWTLNRHTGQIYRTAGCWPECGRLAESGEENVLATYTGGYVAPSRVLAWAASLVILAGYWLRHPTAPELLLECTTAGTMAAGEPTWPTAAGVEVISGTAVLMSRDAQELPEQLRDLAAYSAMTAYQALSAPAGLTSLAAEGITVGWSPNTTPTAALPEVVCRALATWSTQL